VRKVLTDAKNREIALRDLLQEGQYVANSLGEELRLKKKQFALRWRGRLAGGKSDR